MILPVPYKFSTPHVPGSLTEALWTPASCLLFKQQKVNLLFNFLFVHPTEIWELPSPGRQGAVCEPSPTLFHSRDSLQCKGKVGFAFMKKRFCSFCSKTSPEFNWLASKPSWLLFSDLCRCTSWRGAICFKTWHTLALAWLSISSTVDECWLQTLMLVFSCIFFSYSRTSSIVISVKSSKVGIFHWFQCKVHLLLRRRL